MSDLTNVLSRAAESLALPGTDSHVIDADIARGRRALARRRTHRGLTRGGLSIAAVAALVAGSAVLSTSHSPTAPSAHTPFAPSTTKTLTTAAVELVNYNGPQPAAFTVDTVPAGWTVLKADNSMLLIGPVGSKLDESDGMTKLGGDIVVSSVDAPGDVLPDRKPVKVGAGTGYWGTYLGGDNYHGLTFTDGKHTLQLQLPPTLHWTAAEAASFAQGLHVPANALTTHG